MPGHNSRMDNDLCQAIERLVQWARDEDLGTGDITTALLADADQPASFSLIAREPCVFAGREVAPIVLEAYDPAIELIWTRGTADGATMQPEPSGNKPPSHTLASLRGPLASVLAVERVLLNFLQHLCGIATLTRRYVEAVAGTEAVICDTRKTTPGWRLLEKYAVRCGGGTNHRMGLYDGVLIKDNHLSGIPRTRLASAVFDMLNRLPRQTDDSPRDRPRVEVEAESLEQVEPLLSVVGIDMILLDNFDIESLRRAVDLRNNLGLRGKILLEASGGVTLDTVRAVAETGVERISVGALTHSATAVDLSLERIG